MRPISLLAVVSYYPAPSQTFITRKLAGLRDAGVDVTVAATAFAGGATEQGMPLLSLTPWRSPSSLLSSAGRAGWGTLVRGLRGSFETDTAIRDPKQWVALAPLAGTTADIVHFELSGIAVTYWPVIRCLRPAKLVVSCRGAAEQIEPLSNPAWAAALAEVFAGVDLIHCVSDDMRQTVEALGAPPEKILVNRPAVPVADFAPLAERRVDHGGPLRVLSVGRLHWKKALDDGLRAVARAAGTLEVEYRIAGEGPEREKLAYLANELGLGDRVDLLGSQTTEQIRGLLGWADVLLLPSLSEGISNAVLEAMAAGLPVVATACGGMGEVITSEVDGFLVDIGDIEAMAAVLQRLMSSDERRRVGTAAGARAVRDFDLSRQISRFVTSYEALTAAETGSADRLPPIVDT